MQRQIRFRSIIALVCIICFALLLLTFPVLAQDNTSNDGAVPTLDTPTPDAPAVTTVVADPNTIATVASTAPDATLTPAPPEITPTPTPTPSDPINIATTTKSRTEVVVLPTVMYLPPNSSPINPNATDPFFPAGSESCQKCKYFYPKLKECNQIANNTLARLPRLPEGSSSSIATTTTITTTTTAVTAVTASSTLASGPNSSTARTTTGASSKVEGTALAEFTTIMPFLQCICPNQGLAAAKVCMTCFQITNQHNFLDQLESQSVTNSLPAFQEACLDSGNGSYVPPAANRGQSASSGGGNNRIVGGHGGFLLTGAVILMSRWSLSFL
ncbi:hypothetical protein EDD21DRAFT_350541 [Dissophora ornata]|nr:hypothetical protein BGZ58_007804 [Dissophora ornata]KAI8604845.1 hypothetical protein EDD21DRAFT_350541 [Dissophora ornata]